MHNQNYTERPKVQGSWIHQNTKQVYDAVKNSVLQNIRELFYDESLDDQVIEELKLLWDEKLESSRVLDEPVAVPGRIENFNDSQINQFFQNNSNFGVNSPENNKNSKNYYDRNIQQPMKMAKIDNYEGLQSNMYNSRNLNQTNKIKSIRNNTPSPNNFTYQQQKVPIHQHLKLQTPKNQNKFHLDGQNDYSSDSEEEKSTSSESSSSSSEEEKKTERIDEQGNTVLKSSSSESDSKSHCSGSDLEQEEKPLCTDDDISEDGLALFNCDNQILCQYDIVRRHKQRWTIKMRDGIMQVAGRDYIFTRCDGEAEW